MGLSRQQATAYGTQGFISGVRVVDNAQAECYREQFDALESREGREKSQIGLQNRHFDQRFIWDLATHAGILDCIEALIGPDVMLLSTHVFCKYGAGEKFVAWHQDVTYWGLEPPEATTAWYAIDESDTENGCMRVIPGSQRDGIRQHGKSDSTENLLSINQEAYVSAEEESSAVDLVLKAGEMSLHNGSLIHSSLPNRSVRRRSGLTIRYMPPYVKQTERNSTGGTWQPILVRGEDLFGHFRQNERLFPE